MEEFFEKTNKGLSENELKGFEGKINFNLPAEYRNFLEITNGATLKKNYLRLSDSRDDLIVSLDDTDSLLIIIQQIRPRQNMKDKIYIQY
nr:SMI1/KNR4 family protein [uncultured Arsenicibacter sp.]